MTPWFPISSLPFAIHQIRFEDIISVSKFDLAFLHILCNSSYIYTFSARRGREISQNGEPVNQFLFAKR